MRREESDPKGKEMKEMERGEERKGRRRRRDKEQLPRSDT